MFSYSYHLGVAPIVETTEARYVDIGWEMLQSGDYLTPRYNGISHFHKPPLTFWAVAASMRCFGVVEGSARLPQAVAAMLTIAVTGYLGFVAAGCEMGLVAAAVLATSPFFWELGRFVLTDMLMTLAVVVALLCAWQLLYSEYRSLWWWGLWLSLGINFMTKGPVGPLLVLLALAPFAYLEGHDLRRLSVRAGMVVAAVVGLPWYLYQIGRYPGLLNYWLVYHTAERVFTDVHKRPGPPWFYLKPLLLGFLPWTVWIPGALRDAFKVQKSQRSLTLLCTPWLLLPFVFFSLAQSKLDAYVLPLFPAMAILVAGRITRSAGRFELGASAILMLVAGLVSLHPPPPLALFASVLGKAGWIFLAASLLITVGLYTERPRAALAALVGCLLLAQLLGAQAMALAGERHTAKQLAAAIESVAPHAEVAMYRRYLFGLPFYLRRQVVHVEHQRELQFQEPPSDYYVRLCDYLNRPVEGAAARVLICHTIDRNGNARLSSLPVLYDNGVFVVAKVAP